MSCSVPAAHYQLTATMMVALAEESGLYELPEQELLNINVNWESLAGLPLDLSLFATNVTEEEFHTFTTGSSFGFDSLNLNEPRMYGARLKYRFGGG